MAIMAWQSKQVLDRFFRVEGFVQFNEDHLSLEFCVKDTDEKLMITLTPEEIKETAATLESFAKKMSRDIEEME